MTRLGTPSWAIQLRPRFPDGLTVLDARGQWRDSQGAIKTERSKLLVILAPAGRRWDAPDRRDLGRVQEPVRPGVGAWGGGRDLRFVLLIAGA